MKNKWLIGLATGILSVSLCAGMFGCANDPNGENGGGNGSGLTDEQIAQRAINVVKELARDIGDTTSANFEVVGQVPVEGVKYAVTWTATSDDVEDISQYVSIGAMDESTSMCTVTITKGVTAIDYTLTATVTVNQTSKQHSSTHHIPAAPREAAGTEQDPYSPSKVIELASAMTPKAKLEASDNPQRVWVTGRIVDCGTDQTPKYNRVGYVCIVDEDEYSADLKQGDDGVLLILSINYDDTNLTGYSDLVKGNKITVSGFIMNYQKDSSTDPKPEITYYGSEGIQCSYLEKADLSPAEKVERALGKVNGTLSFSETGDHDLPASTVDGVTFTWTTDDETYTIENNKLHVGSLPAESTTFDATVTANCDGVTSNNTKTVTITILAEGDAPDYGTVNDPLTVSEAIALGNTIGSNTYLGGASTPTTVVVKGYVVAIDGWDSSHSDWTKVYIAETNDTGATQKVQLYRLGLDDTYLTEQADLVLGAEITVEGCMQYYNGNVEVCHNPATNVNAKAVAYTLPSHTHVWGSYTHTTGFNHTKVCSAANCEFNGEPQTEACTFDENVCEHCSYTAQQAEIVAAYNAMTSGNIPQGTFKLTGTVSNISKFKVGSSGDWQFYFTVDGTEFYVYYASHAVVTANQLSEGDTVTVVGSFMMFNTTKEIASGATITAWTSVNDSKTDAEKAQDVAESFTLSKTVFGTLNEEFELPTDNNYEAQVTWSVDGTTDLVTVTDNTLKIVKLAETEATQVTLKVTVTVGEDSAEHTYHITVNAEGTDPEPTHVTNATYDPLVRGHEQNKEMDKVTDKVKDVSVTYAQSSSVTMPVFYTTEVRVYHNGTITVSVPDGYKITAITLTFSSNDGNTVSANVGTLSGKAWTGSETSVVFTVGAKSSGSTGGHIKLTKIAVTYLAPTAECTHASLTKVDGTPAGCETDGTEDYWTCDECHRWFTKENAPTDADEIFVPVVIDASGHSYTEWVDDGNGATHTAICDNCHTEQSTEAHDKLGEGGKCSKCGGEFTAKMKDVVLQLTKSALGLSTVSYADNNKDHTVGDFDFTTNQVMASGDNIQMQKGTGKGSISNKDGFPGRIKSIVVVFASSQASGTISLGLGTTDALGTTKSLTMSANGTQTFTADEGTDFRFFKLYDPTATAAVVSITITYETLDTSAVASTSHVSATPDLFVEDKH